MGEGVPSSTPDSSSGSADVWAASPIIIAQTSRRSSGVLTTIVSAGPRPRSAPRATAMAPRGQTSRHPTGRIRRLERLDCAWSAIASRACRSWAICRKRPSFAKRCSHFSHARSTGPRGAPRSRRMRPSGAPYNFEFFPTVNQSAVRQRAASASSTRETASSTVPPTALR